MLHLLIENNELKNRVFPIPDGVRKILQQTLDNYNGDKTIDGYKRLNNLLSSDNITYQEMKRIKNFFDNYKGTDESAEYILNGGEPMKNWVNNTLYTATKSVHDFKQAKKDAGINNAFIKPHEKNRQTKKKNKPTQVKFNTNNLGQKMMDNDALHYNESKKKTICITEEQSKMLKEAMDDVFSLETLSSLTSFNARLKYCTQHLGRHIGKGSSRITFQMDDEKVLKLAWNKKGVAQNEEEERAFGDDIFPKVYESDRYSNWLVSEFVLPAKAQDYKHCFGLTFDEFVGFLHASGRYRFGRRYWNEMEEEDWVHLLETNEDLAAFDEYIGNYGHVVIGDMCRMCNYGLTKRNGQAHIVLLDSGFTEDVWNNYYKRY